MTAEHAVIWFGAILVCAAVYVLWKAQHSRSNPINLADLLIDGSTQKTSLRKGGEAVALLATTWVLVYLTIAGKLTDWVFACYVGAWVSRTLLGMLAQAKAGAMTAGKPE